MTIKRKIIGLLISITLILLSFSGNVLSAEMMSITGLVKKNERGLFIMTDDNQYYVDRMAGKDITGMWLRIVNIQGVVSEDNYGKVITVFKAQILH